MFGVFVRYTFTLITVIVRYKFYVIMYFKPSLRPFSVFECYKFHAILVRLMCWYIFLILRY